LLPLQSSPTLQIFPFQESKTNYRGVIFIIGLILGCGFNSLAVIADLNGAGFWGDSQDAAELDREPGRAGQDPLPHPSGSWRRREYNGHFPESPSRKSRYPG
jgi:hypothetical protein